MADTSALRAYAYLIAAQARGQAQYRSSFVVDVLGSTSFAIADLLAVFVLFRVTRTLGGFDFGTSLLMASLAVSGFAIADLAVGNVERLGAYVRRGLLDAVLVRPLSGLGQLLVMDFAPRRIGRVLVNVVVLGVAATRAHVSWTPAHVLLLVQTPLAAAVFFSSIFVATATVAFWWIDSREFANAFTYGGREITSYPLTVFGAPFRMVLGYGLGYAFVGYYPALALLGRPDPLGLPSWAGWCTPAVALLAVGAAGAMWRFGIRHYRSTGS